ncbi:BTB/POZ and MATH domain-containing protein 1 [Brachypodium distachyon]|uniref:BTB domain-containing protein n=1 Tax=Brachypodium distachyon TaxID=15368 RepID=I1I232_BRADI|nr:BTB/POZ and MATH domain-containing protein 1 [Brachypodium distachyon]KQJ95651.1 hypothetical protein BRADI_3g18370v3 [Brachypodium distachyon]PNT66906.1 hypothetical protein BRADI_3g18370v3 [Brachypodium distachyon]|eukprot:XP_003571549.1 BTB/POZ and MATH domain-containing protein 1 [Brachypodium distachyon]
MGSVSKKTISRHTTHTEQGSHAFEISGYSLNKGIGVGQYIQSCTFTVGGYDWAIRLYPDGVVEAFRDYVTIYLELVSQDAEVRALYDLSLVKQETGLPVSMWCKSTPREFRSRDSSRFAPQSGGFIPRSTLEMDDIGYVLDDYLTIECAVTVVKEAHLYQTSAEYEIALPPSDLSDHFGKLLLEEEGADVTFSVGGETFAAHKIVLATRSPVFKAELYGQMKERTAQSVTIEDMQPAVFRAFLHFIYTDSLAQMEDLDHDDYSEMIRHLLVAADRYAMDRLKLICQNVLCQYIDVDTVAATLALADQHNCESLKNVCIDYMTTSDEIDAVAATQGYANLKRSCPSVLIDVLEKRSRIQKE